VDYILYTDTQTYTVSSVQSVSHVWLFATLWTAAHQVSLSITNSQNLLKLMSIELVMPSNHPSGSSQCTSPKHPVSCIEPGLARFIHHQPALYCISVQRLNTRDFIILSVTPDSMSIYASFNLTLCCLKIAMHCPLHSLSPVGKTRV